MVVPQTQRPALSGTALKPLALCSMLLDHLGASCLEAGVFSRPGAHFRAAAHAGCLPAVGRAAGVPPLLLLAGGGLPAHPQPPAVRRADAGLCAGERAPL